ncbi:hypothetical protein [Streptomyces sp. NPDC015131]|uniref:SCO2195 family GlnR-regulated protein n=1 Tax=Streptomyces sp. NPDC015131 TaxID=3364941 RepID=UPI0037021991
MHAATPQVREASPAHRTRPVSGPDDVRAHAFPRVTDALRVMEALLLSGGQRTARRNAWTSVLEDRRRARDRVEAQHVLEAVADRASRAT